MRDETLNNVTLKADAFIKSIGSRAVRIEGVPYDDQRHIIPNDFGCVLNSEGHQIPGLYVAGWAKRGSNGIIDATLRDCRQTFGIFKHHVETNQIEPKTTSLEEIHSLIPTKFLTYSDWRKVDKQELANGQKLDKPREKFTLSEFKEMGYSL